MALTKIPTKESYVNGAWHCRHCGDRHTKGVRRPNHKNIAVLHDDVLEYLQYGVDRDFIHVSGITREAVSTFFNVPNHQAEQVLQKLRIEGYLGAPRHHAPHDSKRDRWGGGRDSAWMGSSYPVHKHKFQHSAPDEHAHRVTNRTPRRF